jgi:hypothetical protein
MKCRIGLCILLTLTGCLLLRTLLTPVRAQGMAGSVGPDPREIPIPRIQTPMGTLPGVNSLPVRKEMPDVMVMNDGAKVATERQWEKRREEMKRILEYYAVGQIPPSPGNLKGQELSSETVLDGSVKYRLIRLTFGPEEKLSLNIGVFTPVKGGPFPAIILQGGTPPGATALPRLPQGPNQGRGEDVLLLVGPAPSSQAASPAPGRAAASPRRPRRTQWPLSARTSSSGGMRS